jgi:hypothetical protein
MPMASMSPPESSVCFAISIEADASKSCFLYCDEKQLARIAFLEQQRAARGTDDAAGRVVKWQAQRPDSSCGLGMARDRPQTPISPNVATNAGSCCGLR